jgi:hypothetical protein
MVFCNGFAAVGAFLGRIAYAELYRKLKKWFKIMEATNVGA